MRGAIQKECFQREHLPFVEHFELLSADFATP